MVTIKTTGFREIEKAFSELGAAASKRLAVRALKKVAAPIRDKAKRLAPKDEQDLEKSIEIGTRTVRSVARPDKDEARVYVGIDESQDRRLHIYASIEEFGNSSHPAQPYFRPAWNTEGRAAIDRIKPILWEDIERTAKRQAKKKG